MISSRDFDEFIELLKNRMRLEHDGAVRYHQRLLSGEEPRPRFVGLAEQLEVKSQTRDTDPTKDGESK